MKVAETMPDRMEIVGMAASAAQRVWLKLPTGLNRRRSVLLIRAHWTNCGAL